MQFAGQLADYSVGLGHLDCEAACTAIVALLLNSARHFYVD